MWRFAELLSRSRWRWTAPSLLREDGRRRPIGALGGRCEPREDCLDHARVLDDGDQAQAAATARAGEHVDLERPPHEIGPRPVTSVGDINAPYRRAAPLSEGRAEPTYRNSGKGSWIHNPISHYVVAKETKLPVAELTGFHPSPAGPAGRHTVGVPRSLGIWKFSKNVDVARDFLKWFFEPAQYHEWIMSGDSYNHPTWRDMENHPVWDVDRKYKPIKSIAQYSHLYGWPAPPDERIQLITNSYIIPNMFARVVTNASKPKEAILWAETEIKRAFERS